MLVLIIHLYQTNRIFFVSYINHSNDDTKPLLTELLKLNAFIKSFVKEKIVLITVNKNILSKYSEIQNKINRLVGKDLDIEVMILIFMNGNDFHDEGLLSEQTSIYKCYKSYYPETLSEDCKYLAKDNETIEKDKDS